jgi:proteasome activator subunit 4
MNLTLPGIDTNDMRKTYCTLKFYKSLLVCLPLFSDHTNPDAMVDENTEDKELPEAVQFFEDWCIQFLDRIFVVLSHQSPPKKDSSNAGDTISPSMFWSICDLFFNQLSPNMHARCLKKVFNFLTTEFLINAKKNIGHMCSAISFSDPKHTLELFVPMCYDRLIDSESGKLRNLTESETQWYVHIMSKVLLLSGAEILNYKRQIIDVIRLTYQSEDKKILKSSGKLIKNVLRSLTSSYALDIRSVNPEVWESEEFKKNHYKYWSEFPTIDNMSIRWHVPSQEEILFSIELVNTFMKLPYELVKAHVDELIVQKDKNSTKKKQIKHALVLIGYIVRGVDSLFPEIEDDIIPGNDRFTGSRPINAGLCLAEQVKDQAKLNYTFKELSLLCHDLCQAILKHKDNEDPALLGLITKLLYPIICKRGGITQLRYKQKRDNHEVIKVQSYKDVYSTRGQKYPRYLIVSRAVLEYKLRCVLHNEAISFTKTHELLLDDLAQLSLSSYSVVRKKAQRVLFATYGKFAEKVVLKYLPRFIDALKDPNSTDDERTGAIYCLEKYASVKNVIRNWDMMHRFLISICQTAHIERQTVQERLAALYDTYFSAFYHVAITSENISQYNNLLLSLVELVESNKNMHWKYQTLVTSFLMLMVRADKVVVPIPVATYFFKQMISDIDKIRHISVESIELILCQYKPVQKKKTISFGDDYSFLEANKWRNIKFPTNNKEWDSSDFYEKNFFGWYTCPKEIEIYDYSTRVSTDNLTSERTKLTEEFTKIMTDDFVKKLFETMVIREDTFSEANSQMFKGMFQIFKQDFLNKCKPHFENLLTKAGSGRQEETHYMSLSAEFVSGLIRGMKHWEYDAQDQTYQYLFPLLDKVLQETSMSCVGEWCECFEFAVCDRDPRRIKWIKDYMFDKFEKMIGNVDDSKLGFQSSSSNQVRYLRYLYGIVGETSWRDPDTLDRLLAILKKHLAHPYEQVRECISIFLSMIFKTRWRPARDQNNHSVFNTSVEVPENMQEFIRFVQEQFDNKLKALKSVDERIAASASDAAPDRTPELTDMKALSKTIMNWSNSLFSSYSPHCGLPFVTEFINLIAKVYGNCTSEDEDVQGLAADNLITISAYSFGETQALKTLNFLNDVLQSSTSTTGFTNWRVRQCLLEFIQVFGFRQQFYLVSEQDKLIELILSMLKDPQLEVRECASNTLAGFIKISEPKYIEQLVNRFRVWVKGDSVLTGKKQSRQKRKRASITSLQSSRNAPVNENDTLLRHSGVLGLSAIVKAFPYTLPDFLPAVLVQLAQFSNDHSQPVRDSTRKTFAEFWKQHGDLWHIQKKKLTANQLQVLNSLLISPSYYA